MSRHATAPLGQHDDHRVLRVVESMEQDLREGDAGRAVARLSRHAELIVEWSFDAPLDRLEELLHELEAHHPEHPWVLYFLAWVWVSQRNHERALVTVRRAERRFEEVLSGDELARASFLCRMAAGVIAQAVGRYEDARVALEEAARLANLSRPELSEDQRRWVRFDQSGMIRFWLQAAALYEQLGLPLSLGRAHHNIGVLILDRGEPVPARRRLETAYELKLSGGSRLALANTLNALGQAERHLGLLGQAGRHLEEAISLAEELHHDMVLSYALNNLAEVHRDGGHFHEAEALYEQSMEIKERAENLYGLAFSLASRADLFLISGRPQKAVEDARRAVDLRATSTDALEHARLAAILARARLANGALQAGEELASRAGELEGLDAKGELAVARWWESVWRKATDRPEEAERAARSALELTAGHRLEHLLAPHAALRPDPLGSAPSQGGAAEAAQAVEELAGSGPWSEMAAVETNPGLPRLSARLLGPLRVFIDDREVPLDDWRSRKAVSLLGILLHSRGDPVHREQAMEWLWPGVEPERSGRSLNVALSAVRRGLEELDRRASSLIERSGPFYRLVPEALGDLDVHRFLDLARKADELDRNDYRAAALRRAGEALELVEGEYLASEGYKEWRAAERARWAEMALDLRLRAAEWSLSLGWGSIALDHATEALVSDPLRERAWRVLIEVHRRSGDRAAALRAFEECQQTLEDRLGMEPSPELMDLAKRLRGS